MDGLEATREIRRKNPDHQALTIIACTSNVFRDDCAACLGAGMNHHIGKPIAQRDLERVLLRWVGVTKK